MCHQWQKNNAYTLRCGLPHTRRPDGSLIAMPGRPHKGDRVLLAARPHREVWEIISRRAAAAGQPMSQYVADLLAVHVGRDDLIFAAQSAGPSPLQEELPLLT